MLRAPGTVNRKAGQERLCRVIESDGPFHHLDDLDKALPPLSPKGVAPRHDQGGQDADGPFDALRRAGWSDILEPVGWSYVKHDHRGELWMRPGDAESEYSAVAFEDVFYVHSTSTVLPDREGMSKGTLFAALHHGGNLSAAAHDLIGAATGGTATRAALSLPPDVLAAIADTQTAPTWEPLTFPAGVLEALNPGMPPLRPKTVLTFQRFAELAADVDAQGPRTWLLRGLWPDGDYGVHAAEAKAQKTWNTVDLAVSVASGRPWLGAIEVDTPGPVVMFVGEGGKGNTVRRIRAVAAEKEVDPDILDIYVCTRVPHLNDRQHMAALAEQIKSVRPSLVTLDPLYLAARGANLADLYSMGEALEGVQHICQNAGTSLFVVTHFNRKQGGGASRITGAGPGEWGRVLATAVVKKRKGGLMPKESDVLAKVAFVGGEIGDQTLMVHRRVWSDDPDDLDSSLNTLTEAWITDEADGDDSDDGMPKLRPAATAILAALRRLARASTYKEVNDDLAERGTPYRQSTFSTAIGQLRSAGLVEEINDPRAANGTFRAGLYVAVSGERSD